MRVVIDATAIHPTSGGAGTYLRSLVAHLPDVNVEPIVLARRNDPTSWVGAADVVSVGPEPRAMRLVWEQTRLPLVVKRFRTTGTLVLHSPHYTMPHLVDSAIARVVTIHDLTFFSRPQDHDRAKRFLFQRAIRYAAQHADAMVCVSEATEHRLREEVPVSAPVFVAHHGVDLDRFGLGSMRSDDHMRADRRLLEAHGVIAPYVLHLGAIEPRKRIGELIEAVGSLVDAFPALQLVLAGKVWPSYVGSMPVARPFERRLGYVDDDLAVALMQDAAVVVYPSAEEGFGLPVLESMACGAPVVTTRGSAMAEVAGDSAMYADESGGLVSGLIEVLRDAMARAGDPAGDPAGAAARRHRAEQFTWSATALRHAEAYEAAIKRISR
jgi:glycosyltransferase involved in cell wall biosynthesis